MGIQNRKVVEYRRPIRLNIGIVFFLFILAYIVVITLSFFNKKHITIYEVTEKNIADDNICQGIIIREENVVATDKAGYANYYVGDGSRVAKNATVYTLDESGTVYDILSGSEKEEAVSSEDSARLRRDIAQFRKNYTPSNFSQTQELANSIDNTVLESTHISLLSNLNAILSKNHAADSFHVLRSSQSGIVSYFSDGLEGLTAEQVGIEHFDKEKYPQLPLRSTTEAVEAGARAYKMITSEDWAIVLSLTAKQYEKLHGKETEQLAEKNASGRVNIRFVENDLKAAVNFTAYQKGEHYFARLDLDKYLNYFVDKRYVEVELSLNSASGLKIPASSVLSKKFYQVPLSCFTVGGNSSSKGIVKEVFSPDKEVEYQFIATDLYYEDEEFGYIDMGVIEAGDWIRNPETQERCQISQTTEMTGVYNANKGYCVFRRIEKVYENEEYCIIKEDTPYGLSTYDHIIADASTVTEQEIMK